MHEAVMTIGGRADHPHGCERRQADRRRGAVRPTLHAAPYWLATIDTRRMEKDDPRRLEILNYQRNPVDALYAWAQSPKALAPPTNPVPSEQINKPSPPAADADLDAWPEYHLQMVAWIHSHHALAPLRGAAPHLL